MSVFTPDMGKAEQFIVAHPNSMVVFTSLQSARDQANTCRHKYPVKIYRLIEVEHHFQRGRPPPPPTKPPTGTATVKAA